MCLVIHLFYIYSFVLVDSPFSPVYYSKSFMWVVIYLRRELEVKSEVKSVCEIEMMPRKVSSQSYLFFVRSPVLRLIHCSY